MTRRPRLSPSLFLARCRCRAGGLFAAAGFRGSDLSIWLRDAPVEDKTADLRLAELRRWTFATAPIQAILRQAMDIMHKNTAEAVCIYERSPNTGKQMLHDQREHREIVSGKYALIV